MEYREFKILKKSGTYSELLETYGLANLIDEILLRNNAVGQKITIEEAGLYYSVKSNKDITDEMIDGLQYFPIFKFIIKDEKTVIPDGIIDYFNYPEQKKILDDFKERFNAIEKNKQLNTEQKKIARKNLNAEKSSEFGKNIDPEFDVYREIKGNPYASFRKLFDNFHQNQSHFPILIKEILCAYSQRKIDKRDFKLIDEKPTAQQLYNPNQGKGLNKGKANSASMGNLNSNWISESMKISGALSMMVCQLIKMGDKKWDLKIYVPEFN